MKSRTGMIAVSAVVAVVAGAVLIFGGSTSSADEGDNTQSVLVASEAISIGTATNDLISSGAVKIVVVDNDEAMTGALGSVETFADRTVSVDIAQGAQVLETSLTRPTLRSAAIEVPEGTEAVSIEVPFTNGGAGYIAPGDRVNVMALISQTTDGSPRTVTVLEGAEVLDVSDEVAPRVANQRGIAETTDTAAVMPIPTRLTYLVAVPVADVPRVVQTIGFHQAYITLPAEGSVGGNLGAAASDMDILGAS